MIKKLIILLIILTIIYPDSKAFGSVAGEYYPPADSDYYRKKISYKLYIPRGAVKLRITQYTPLPEQEVHEVIEWDVKENSFIWVDMWCKGNTRFQYLDEKGEIIEFHVRGEGVHIDDGTCPEKNSVTPSDYNEEEKRYSSDTFGGKYPKLENPDPDNPDGSGGTGETGYIPDPGNGKDPGNGDDPNNPGDPGGCGCNFFDLPGWKEHMEKIDEIISKIPPPPNWDEIADKIRDSLIPGIKDEIIGTPPERPKQPAKPPGVDDKGIMDKMPEMKENPDLKDIADQITPENIKNTDPIPEREDPTGGFDLIQDPISSLPELPGNDFPKPGETDPGEWGENIPKENENPYPKPPQEQEGEGDPPPIPPGTDPGTPPKPGDDTGNPPTPGTDPGTPPTPGGDGDGWGMKYYKKNPGDPDGSGGDWIRP